MLELFQPLGTRSNATATTITANKSLTLQQVGDTYGTSSLTLQNRNKLNGITIQNLNPTATVTDVALQRSSFTRYMRLESRSGFTQCGAPELQLGRSGPRSATLFLGDNYAYTPKPFVIGTQATTNTTPSNTLTITGTLSCSGQISGHILFCTGKVNPDGTKAVLSPNSLADFACSVLSNVYKIRFGTSHPAGANYVMQVSGQGAVATASSITVPTVTGFRVVLYSLSAAWATPIAQPLFFTVLH